MHAPILVACLLAYLCFGFGLLGLIIILLFSESSSNLDEEEVEMCDVDTAAKVKSETKAFFSIAHVLNRSCPLAPMAETYCHGHKRN